MKNPSSHDEVFTDPDSEIYVLLLRIAALQPIGRLCSGRRSAHDFPFRWSRASWCGLYGGSGVAIALLAWYPGHWLIALLVLPALWSASRSRWLALSLWAGYYLTGARDLPIVCERFFVGYGELSTSAALTLGVAFWLGQAFVLAAPWALLTPGGGAARHARRTVLAVMLVSLPPLGIIGWLSPLHVASALFPGSQIAGLVLGVCALATAACVRRPRSALSLGIMLMSAAVVAHLVEHRPELPVGWTAIDTTLGRLDQRDYAALYSRTQATMESAQRQFDAGARVVVVPEELVGLWRPAMRYWWRDYLLGLAGASRTLILGVDLTDASSPLVVSAGVTPILRYTDSAVVVGDGRGRFDSRQPVPAGLWRPWAIVSAMPGSLTQPYLDIAGRRAAFSICYEDFLWWPHWRLLIDRPDILVGLSNGWFTADLALAQIQQQSVQSIAQLAGIPLLRAVNR